MTKPNCSIIIPTYNRAHTLMRALDSVVAQTDQDIDIIVVDDGSTDDTPTLVTSRYLNVTYINQHNRGVSAARNTGIKQAKGEWIALLDSDDAWHHSKLEQQFCELKKTNKRICHTNEIWYRHGKRVNAMKKHEKRGGWIFQYNLPFCRISPSSVVIHRSIFEHVGLFNETLPACEDYDLWLRICAHYPVLYLDKPLTLKYGGHADQLSKAHWGMDRFRIQALRDLLDSQVLTPDDELAARTMLAKKISLYIKGATKRNKQAEINQYEQWQTQYCDGIRL